MIFIVGFGKKSMLTDFTAAHFNLICIHQLLTLAVNKMLKE